MDPPIACIARWDPDGFFQEHAAFEVEWRPAGPFSKGSAERAKTFITDFEADIRYSAPRTHQQFGGPFHSSLNQILIRRFAESNPKGAQKMKWRNAGNVRKLLQIDWF